MGASRRTDARAPGRASRAACARIVGLAWLAVAAASIGPATTHAAGVDGQVEWRNVDRVLAFADVHGAYSELVGLLRSQGVIDADLHWSAGRTQLVSLGDLLDRGDDSRKVMDLLMRLQPEAAAAGGGLQVVLGNHEAMNVLGDLRYVSPGDYAEYVADEDPTTRKASEADYLARNPGRTAQDFERLFPPGYFGHRALLGPQGKYGAWILRLPVAIVVNDTLFVHGGLSRALDGRSVAALDRDYAQAIADYLATESELEAAGLLYFEDPYYQRADLAARRLAALAEGGRAPALADAVERFRKADANPLLGPEGPNWYRGSALCNECAEADVLKPLLRQAGVARVVVGHTVARQGTAVTRFDGALVKLDAGMNKAFYHGRAALLISDASGIRVAYSDPVAPPAPVPPEPLYVSSQSLDEGAVAALLAQGSVQPVETCGPGVVRVRVSQDGQAVDAVFEAAPRETVAHEIAAWRLDRLLGLGLVPATVARAFEGREGVLQGRPPNWATEQDRQNRDAGRQIAFACQVISNEPREPPLRRPAATAAVPGRLSTGGYCDIQAQYQLSYAFDALIGNRARSLDRYLYDLDPTMQARGLSLILSGHGSAFGTDTRIPDALEKVLAGTGPEMQSRLRTLDRHNVTEAIGDSVGDSAVTALLKRRDRILKLAASAAH